MLNALFGSTTILLTLGFDHNCSYVARVIANQSDWHFCPVIIGNIKLVNVLQIVVRVGSRPSTSSYD